jgi:hypothetical protein
MRFLLRDQISIQRAVLDGFGEVGRLDIFLTLEVGNRSSYLQNSRGGMGFFAQLNKTNDKGRE